MLDDQQESVGEQFSGERLQQARDKTLAVIEEAAKLIKAGTSENQARQIVAEIQTRMGAPKSWHPPQIRFGVNTLLPFGKKGVDDLVLDKDDIFFIDIGPIFDGHEGDVGRAYVVGENSEMRKCCTDVALIWAQVRDHWKQNHVTGTELYQFAETLAEAHGWVLCLEKANGHRIADFPHAARLRGSIQAFEKYPAFNRWILEIQIRHKTKPFGAFYEDLLN